MATLLQILENDAFTLTSLTAAIQKLPYEERRIGQLGLFEPVALETDVVTIDEEEGQIQIYHTKPRGSDPQRALKDKDRKSRSFKVPFIPVEDRISASTLMGKRKTGQTALESVADKINGKFSWMKNQMESTFEFMRLNALKGNLLDKNGDVLLNMYSAFDVVQISEDFEFTSPTLDVRNRLVQVQRTLEDEMGGIPFTGVHVLCGRDWFDELVSHASVIDTYRYQQAIQNRSDLRKRFDYAGVTFEEYRGFRGTAGGLSAGVGQIADDEAVLFPLGVTGMFRHNYAPGEFLETVNTLGEPMYARIAPDLKYNKYVDLYVEASPLFINTRPSSVIKLTKS